MSGAQRKEAHPRFDRDQVLDALDIGQVAEALRLDIDDRKSRPAKGDLWFTCPFHAERTASLHILVPKGFYYCFGCHEKGDLFRLIMGVERCGFAEALAFAADLAGVGPVAPEDKAARKARADERDAAQARRAAQVADEDARDAARSLAVCRRWWSAAKANALIGAYLTARGIDLDLIGGVPPSLRLLWQAFEADDLASPLEPVMIAPFQNAQGYLTGTHRTFLQPDGNGKRHGRDRVKRMYGSCWGHSIRLFPAAPVIGIAEGIESALGWACFQAQRGSAVNAWAAGSSGNIADALVLPEGVNQVILIGDNDTKNKPGIEADLKKAEARLRAAGLGVRRDMPPRGMDYLDYWNEQKTWR